MPPRSGIFEVQSIAGAGRGLLAKSPISEATRLLTCADPAVHVIFREYRKEVCAYCFHYDRGRSLSIRANDIGKVFCSVDCQIKWRQHYDDLEVKAWVCLETFVKNNSKNIRVLTADMLQGAKPSPEIISTRWLQCDETIHDNARGALLQKKPRNDGIQISAQSVFPDVLAFELSAILLHHFRPDVWERDIKALVIDSAPYKSQTELDLTCNSIIQLSKLLPAELLTSCNSSVSLTATAAGSHNAFGIRAGGEDNEEYLAWAIYPDASYFNHSCDPNVSKQRLGREWHFSARRQILPGEQLCISYLGGDEKDMSVKQRRDRLESVWGFICACQHCQADDRR